MTTPKLHTTDLTSVLYGYSQERLWPHSAVHMGYGRETITAMIQAYTGDDSPIDFNAPFWGLSRSEHWRHHPCKGWALCGPRGVVTEEREHA